MTASSPSKPVVFATSGLGGMFGWIVVHPANTCAVRMSLASMQGKKISFADMVRQNGVMSLYDGLAAGLWRQVFYATSRLGLFEVCRDKLHEIRGKTDFASRVVVGAATGATAAFISCPMEVACVRMSNDATLPVSERRNYKGIQDVVKRIYTEEGARAFWRGSIPFSQRAALVGVFQASKNRMASQKPDKVTGKLPYTSTLQTMRTVQCVSLAAINYSKCDNIIIFGFSGIASKVATQLTREAFAELNALRLLDGHENVTPLLGYYGARDAKSSRSGGAGFEGRDWADDSSAGRGSPSSLCLVFPYHPVDLADALNHRRLKSFASNPPHNYFCLPPVAVQSIAHDIMSALKHLHDHHILHRDVKPVKADMQRMLSFKDYTERRYPQLTNSSALPFKHDFLQTFESNDALQSYVTSESYEYTKSGFYGSIAPFAPLLFTLGLLYPVSSTIRSVVLEKELRQKELMKK
ncbi:hypothetical protein ACHAXA_008271 [Cyclostephanos tholiformis]|uniref:Protein kinase domain-containing protein n=1 Tax=Cyclostephanos tholiformis TaxID=382380 RepID=A0ABD3R422_9STRA